MLGKKNLGDRTGNFFLVGGSFEDYVYSHSDIKWNKYAPFKNRDEIKRGGCSFFLQISSKCLFPVLFIAQYQWEETGYLNSWDSIPTFSWKLNFLPFFLIELKYINDMYLNGL